ncbi:LysR substrate-binding domain-containing protein [Roseomonas gilardii]|uniref:LysR substrate-binding domain-containing protein n=1 Tax=Roseomonas gilardii TaxID=257708 RepID=A0ABU3ML37_9PROT|nr:LysR substrate-binding domain-containing protein [Roseomonas gilardii]MDT8333213.1 LysR substrate-binding domain-containing protein [Roseomonas gilardii]
MAANYNKPKPLDPVYWHASSRFLVASGVEVLSAPVVAAVARAASQVQLRFVPKPDKEVGPLREGLIDLEIGLRGTSAPEIRTRLLFHDRFVGVVRTGHPLLAGGEVTPKRYAACRHVAASREGETYPGR